MALAFRAARTGARCQGEPGQAAAPGGRPPAPALAQSANSVVGNAGGAVQDQGAWAGPAYRRLEFHGRADRGGDAPFVGAAGLQSDRDASVSRPIEGGPRLSLP